MGWICWINDRNVYQSYFRRKGLAATKRIGPNDQIRQPMDICFQRCLIRGKQPFRSALNPVNDPQNMRHPHRLGLKGRQEFPHAWIRIKGRERIRRQELHSLWRQPSKSARNCIFRQARPAKRGQNSRRSIDLPQILGQLDSWHLVEDNRSDSLNGRYQISGVQFGGSGGLHIV